MRAERGFSLLEVLAAVAILRTSGLATIELVRAQQAAVSSSRAREADMVDAERLLIAYSLLRRSDLDLRLGSAPTGPYDVTISRPTRSLYRIAIGRIGGEPEMLVTVVHRDSL